MRRARTVRLLVLPLLALLAAGCATTPKAGTTAAVAVSGPGTSAPELRLGYFANVTHATPVYGVGTGEYQKALGSTRLAPQIFGAGPAAVEALFAGSLDAAYLGPGPAVNAFTRSGGAAVRIVAGATSGGASLVVKPSIATAADLRGRKLASPQTGGTQDIALRSYLARNGLHVDERGGGDATIVAQDNAQTLTSFRTGAIDGAWVPEPWASRLVLEGGGTVLVDEKDLWPGGRFVTTLLLVRTDYLRAHPQTVQALLQAEVTADREILGNPPRARAVVNAQLAKLTGALQPRTLDRAFGEITVTEDPLAGSLRTSAEAAFATGLVKRADLHGIYDLTLLRQVLGHDVDDAGLGD